jgi:predicted RNA binding protein YcfA (HicA-like mRNA interferase family)
MNKLRLFSSREVINALKRAGFELARKSAGSHQSLKREREDGRHDVVVVPLGKKEIPRGTFQNIPKQAKMSKKEFLDLV